VDIYKNNETYLNTNGGLDVVPPIHQPFLHRSNDISTKIQIQLREGLTVQLPNSNPLRDGLTVQLPNYNPLCSFIVQMYHLPFNFSDGHDLSLGC
jgi:hypothetical protein